MTPPQPREFEQLQHEIRWQIARARCNVERLRWLELWTAQVEDQVAATNDRLAAMRGGGKYRERAEQARQQAEKVRRWAAQAAKTPDEQPLPADQE